MESTKSPIPNGMDESNMESDREASRSPILVFVVVFIVALSLLSIPQKILIGADPFALKGFIVPAIFGGLTGFIIGALFVRNKQEYLRRIRSQQEATRDLVASEERFRLLAENARDVIFLWSLTEHRFQYISPSVYNLTGHLPEEFYVNPGLFSSIVHSEDRPQIDSLGESISRGELPPSLEFRLRHRDGQSVWVNQRHTASLDPTGRPLSLEGICTDISAFRKERKERISLEQQLQLSQKMDAIGRLAGGVFHDFNNLLTVINGYVDLLIFDDSELPDKRPELEGIKKAGRKAADLTNQLLTFSRNQVSNPQTFNPGLAVQDSLKMIRRLVDESIQIQTDIPADLPNVFIDPIHLDQILVNLVLNARDAIDKSGVIEVKMDDVDLTGEFCNKCKKPLRDDYLILSVTDNGVGIAPEIIDHIFDPFFTTKEVGQGTGLGLSTTFGIAHQMGGHVQVWSQPDQGATFRVLIPLLGDQGLELQDEILCQSTLKGDGETLLIVEDEALVRSLAATVLGQHGYNIHLADNGQTALRFFEEKSSQVDLVLTDIVMPEMDGIELAKKLHHLAPKTPILFMSGYLDEVLNSHAFDPNSMPMLKKPFGAEELVRRVKQMLDEIK